MLAEKTASAIFHWQALMTSSPLPIKCERYQLFLFLPIFCQHCDRACRVEYYSWANDAEPTNPQNNQNKHRNHESELSSLTCAPTQTLLSLQRDISILIFYTYTLTSLTSKLSLQTLHKYRIVTFTHFSEHLFVSILHHVKWTAFFLHGLTSQLGNAGS